MFKILIGVLIAAFVVIVGFMVIDPNIKAGTQDYTTLVTSQNTLSYTIEGEVSKAGTYTLSDVATMQDLIDAAGGLTSNADSRCFFSDTVISKSVTYYIAPLYNESDICNTSEIDKVNVNVDDSEKLMTINGVTSSIASSIVSHRTSNGEFKTIESLMDVYGIGNATYKKIRNYVILHE